MCLIASSARSGVACASFRMVLPEIVMTCDASREPVKCRLDVRGLHQHYTRQVMSHLALLCMQDA